MSHLKDRLARVWAEDLQARLPEGHKVYPQRRPVKRLSGRPAEEVEPPFTVLRVKAIEQTAPGENVWIAEVRVLVVCDKNEGGSSEQEKRLEEIRKALEATPTPSADVEEDVRLYGFSLDTIEEATQEKVYADVIFLTAGAGDLASSPGATVLAG